MMRRACCVLVGGLEPPTTQRTKWCNDMSEPPMRTTPLRQRVGAGIKKTKVLLAKGWKDDFLKKF